LGLWPGSSTPNDEAGSIDCWPFTDAIDPCDHEIALPMVLLAS